MSDTSPVSVEEVKRIAVLGAGTMGHGIAQVAALAGFEVSLQDVDESVLENARKQIQSNLDKGVERGKVEAAARDAALARLRMTAILEEATRGADVVVEAVPEKLELKRELFRAAAGVVSARALLVTNTSSLSIARIADSLPAPGRVIGMHFFNPVHIMKLVEVVHHDGNPPAAVQCARALAERFGKTAIVVRDAPGFASSRLGIAIGLEAMRMVEEGVASAADIDTAMKLGYGHPMGPLELTDLVGLDIRLHVADYLAETIGARFRAPEILRARVAEGKLGKKSGEGFYRWKDGKKVS